MVTCPAPTGNALIKELTWLSLAIGAFFGWGADHRDYLMECIVQVLVPCFSDSSLHNLQTEGLTERRAWSHASDIPRAVSHPQMVRTDRVTQLKPFTVDDNSRAIWCNVS